MFTFLVEWHAGAVSLPSGDVIFAQLACPLNDVIFCLHLQTVITNLSLYKHSCSLCTHAFGHFLQLVPPPLQLFEIGSANIEKLTHIQKILFLINILSMFVSTKIKLQHELLKRTINYQFLEDFCCCPSGSYRQIQFLISS